jgi:ankyrin repeat protein
MLIEHHAYLAGDDPLLHNAIPSGNIELVKLLIDYGASTTIQYVDMSPLFFAIFHGLKDIAVLLIEHSPPSVVSGINTRYNSTPLHKALRKSGFEDVVRLLLDKGADVSIRSFIGTPAHLAASEPSEQNLRLLLDKGVDISAAGRRGNTLLHEAVRGGQEGNVKLLLSRGADVSAQNRHRDTPLHRAVYYGNEVIIKLLLDSGANVSIKNYNGLKPFEMEPVIGVDEDSEGIE